MITHTIDQFILDPNSKQDKVKVTNLKNLPKLQIFEFEIILYGTHLLKLLDKMCKHEMDPASIVEDTERTRFCPQTDGHLYCIFDIVSGEARCTAFCCDILM